MIATDEETALKEFLDEEIPCDIKPCSRTAQIYVKFSCSHCELVQIWASCKPCWEHYQSLCTPDAVLMCFRCKNYSRVDSVVNLGPIR